MLALRCQGLTFREIGEKLGIPLVTAWDDVKRAGDELRVKLEPEAAREMLVATQSEVIGLLMQSLREQVEVGQITVVENDERVISRTTKRGINPALATATNQALSRLASLMGLDVAADISVNVTQLSESARQSIAPLDPASYLQMLNGGAFPQAITTAPPPLASAAVPLDATVTPSYLPEPPEAPCEPADAQTPSVAPLQALEGPGTSVQAKIPLPPLQGASEGAEEPIAAARPRVRRHPRPRAF